MSTQEDIDRLQRRVMQVKDSCRAKVLEYRSGMHRLAEVLRLLQEDNHLFRSQPCPTCDKIASLLGRHFGCGVKMKQTLGKE